MLTEVSFRRAERADALCLSVLATQVFLDTYATDGIRPLLAREVLETLSPDAIGTILAAPSSAVIVAERADHLIAFAQLALGATHALVPNGRATELNRLYVQERFTGHGLGRALLREAEALATAAGASTLWLTAWIGNARALAFYPRLGYRALGATMYEFGGEQFENRLFAKALSR